MLLSVKILLGLKDGSNDDILKIMIADAEQTVLNYCHIKKLPKGLEGVVRQLVIGGFKNNVGAGEVESVKRGDTQITYFAPINASGFTAENLRQMNNYRKVILG